jgi:hypothetical protein
LDLFIKIAQVASYITTITAAAALIIRPIRERVLGMKQIHDGQKCLLRSDMLRTYYRHRDSREIRQYEYENFILEYDAYRALNGNSFMEKIHDDVQTWKILT